VKSNKVFLATADKEASEIDRQIVALEDKLNAIRLRQQYLHEKPKALPKIGRPLTTGRFDTREMLEQRVRQRFKINGETYRSVARWCGVTDRTVRAILLEKDA
jgi:hypothetical protein